MALRECAWNQPRHGIAALRAALAVARKKHVSVQACRAGQPRGPIKQSTEQFVYDHSTEFDFLSLPPPRPLFVSHAPRPRRCLAKGATGTGRGRHAGRGGQAAGRTAGLPRPVQLALPSRLLLADGQGGGQHMLHARPDRLCQGVAGRLYRVRAAKVPPLRCKARLLQISEHTCARHMPVAQRSRRTGDVLGERKQPSASGSGFDCR